MKYIQNHRKDNSCKDAHGYTVFAYSLEKNIDF